MDPLGKKHMSAWLRVDGRMACLLLTHHSCRRLFPKGRDQVYLTAHLTTEHIVSICVG